MRKQATLFAFITGVMLAALSAQTGSSARAGHKTSEIEPLLARISTYEAGADPEPAVQFDELVAQSLGSAEMRKALEASLLRFLQSKATAAGKEIAFRELSLVGTMASIPVLAPLLARAETQEMARYALAAIPGPEADEALRKALDQAAHDRIRIGLINSLGHRKDNKSVPALAALVSSPNSDLASAAAAALANIADRPSLNALDGARSKATGPVRDLVAEAYVACADQFALRGEKAVAVNVYRQMIAPGEPPMVRTRALTGFTGAAGKGAVPALTAAIESTDAAMQAVAIRLLNGIPGPDITLVMVTEFAKAAPFAQVHLLTAMANRGDATARPTVLAALKSDAPGVRAAALAGMGRLGDASSVMALAEAAAAGQGQEQNAARRSLYELRGPGIDPAIIAAIGSSSGKVKSELIAATGERVSVTAADALTRAAKETDPEVRREALRALRNVGGSAQTAALLDLLLNASSAAERRDATQTLALVLRRAQPAPVRPIIAAYNSTSALDSRLSMIEVMGQASNEEALPLLRSGVGDASPQIARAAILALSGWDTAAPLLDLLTLAKGAPRLAPPDQPEPATAGPGGPGRGRGGFGGPPPTNNMQVLALRGALKLLVLPSQRPVSESGRLLAQAMSLASQPAEKLAVLSLLAVYPCKESLQVAQAATRDAVVANEAKVALAQVNEALKLR